ncbi:DoxX family protein [Luteolibacter algae]|uniref:DoxX family protein n=1 Tax=Luteolibacter algae TaxID=454151 RepID=A0ABW5DDA9_9BACT
MRKLLISTAPPSTILIRIMIGGVFLGEGIQKFLYSETMGSGRFEKIGIPSPDLMGPFVGSTEIVCGVLVLLGLATRYAVIPLLAIMAVAIFTTKIPILLGAEFFGFAPRSLDRYGLLGMLHESRTDLSMTFGSLYLLIVGAGRWSLDAVLTTANNEDL